jgi:hypothetical protein
VQQVELIASQLFGAQMFGGAAKVFGKLLDRPYVTADRFIGLARDPNCDDESQYYREQKTCPELFFPF